jgi:hypothetical protein
MKESDFYRRIKDKMESYEEIPDPSSWDSIQNDYLPQEDGSFFQNNKSCCSPGCSSRPVFNIGKDSIWSSLDPR